ncbi:YtrH family sporulation protein [Effusibacillus lacus]|uniref:Sporulation protein n=1 Tax=Effusibacillus lacus TaxID=1348429 RepID=A0A292YP30_9BACL|nr:YtrH family sporulation protein [Effusibacillus lacus]TCS72281.1 sporulation protein YtrH [Effusibacillus lacus]GAX90245.1 sporulation protein [Effusibacillus lacus]
MGFLSTVIIDFCVALGMVLGGSMIGAVGALITHHPPMDTMLKLADQLKIWALLAALGGSMDTLKIIGDGVWEFKFNPVLKQFAYLVACFLGCQTGFYLVKWIVLGRES